MPIRSKTPAMTPAEQEQFRASLIVNAAKHFDLPVSALGVPPATVNKQTCSGHGKSDDCVECRFGRCQWCMACYSAEKVFWKGCCDKCKPFQLDAETAESHTRVREIAEAQLGPVSGGRVKRKAVRRSEEEVAAEPVVEEVGMMKRAPAPKVAKKPTQPPPAAVPKKRNTASAQPLSQGAAGMRVVAQTSQLVNHADGTATLTTITQLAPM
jgi:hypothetical protein